VKTDEWLETEFRSPEKICSRFSHSFMDASSDDIYEYLAGFGMYTPNRRSWAIFERLKEMNIWEQVSSLLEKYKKSWNGPNINIYLFPMNTRNLFGINKSRNKSGVSFKDKMFLFLTPFEDEKELEALFVHEYHHICRMNKQNKSIKDYTLLDSIILEGTAEFSVEQICGQEYRAGWCHLYSSKEIDRFWNTFVKNNLTIKRDNILHDQILFGHNGFPKLLGYATGYELVKRFFQDNDYSPQKSFVIPARRFID
jgi:uncharacterized protein YjaZ